MRISSTSDFLHVAVMIEKVLQILFWSSTPVSRRVRVYLGSTLVAYLHVFVLTKEQPTRHVIYLTYQYFGEYFFI